MMKNWTPIDDELPIMFWSGSAPAALKGKLSPLAIDWLSALMEVTEHARQPT